MNACAAFGGVEADADGGIGVFGDGRALVEIERGVRLTCSDDLHTASGKLRPKADVEGEIGRFLELTAIQVCAGVVAAVGRVDEDNEARDGWRHRWRLRLRKAGTR